MAAVECIGVIPARFASTRFPGKPLALIGGKPMIQWVYEGARKARSLQRVLVATDDERIAEAVRSFGGESMLTSAEHACGTDRLAEVAGRAPNAGILVNIQGDEPLIRPESIDLAVRRLVDVQDAGMSTLVAACPPEDWDNPNVVKVVLDSRGMALYFSRAPIPYERTKFEGFAALKHIGLYAYKRDFLLKFAAAAPTPLEQKEGLEQLRALEMGWPIACAHSPYDSIGVDTPEDIERVLAALETGQR
ncbi:MAG: 3-deoxy-manno-octulosonate cytidylyltransferase [Armatimonadota bacterium]|nr:3-deoxy-manno-octulosonate cytidylyltransferase [Armatimonadota bacterium]